MKKLSLSLLAAAALCLAACGNNQSKNAEETAVVNTENTASCCDGEEGKHDCNSCQHAGAAADSTKTCSGDCEQHKDDAAKQ